MKKSISVIIPTFNGKDLLMKYLPSCERALLNCNTISQYEIIVVDDCSNDDTVDFIKENYPHVLLIINSKNVGFSKTINKGIFASQMELALLLNNDMELPENFFEKMIPYFFQQPNLFGISSEIRDITGEKVLEGVKLPWRKHGMLHYKDCLDKNNCHTLYICGGNALVDNKKLKELGGFNELFSPFYFEDFDLGLRAWRKNWKLFYTNDTYCKHCHSTTIFKENKRDKVEQIFLRNKFLLNYLNNNKINNLKMFFYLLNKFILSYIAPSHSQKNYRIAIKEFRKLLKNASAMRQEKYLTLPALAENKLPI